MYIFDFIYKYTQTSSSQYVDQQQNIIVQKADKGNIVVLTDKVVYLEGMKEILHETKFKLWICNVDEMKWKY